MTDEVPGDRAGSRVWERPRAVRIVVGTLTCVVPPLLGGSGALVLVPHGWTPVTVVIGLVALWWLVAMAHVYWQMTVWTVRLRDDHVELIGPLTGWSGPVADVRAISRPRWMTPMFRPVRLDAPGGQLFLHPLLPRSEVTAALSKQGPGIPSPSA